MKKGLLKKVVKVIGLPLCLGVSFVLCRFVFLYIHHMKQWSELLAIISLIILVAAMVLDLKWMSVTTAFGYIVGFIIGAVFNTNGVDPGGGGTNNFWSLWALTIMICIFAGFVIDVAIRVKRAKR